MNSDHPIARPTIAVALNYDEESAPRVTAKGQGDIAEHIMAIARANNIPLQENPELVKVLVELELGSQIPEALYLAVAEVIAFAYLLRGKFPKNWDTDTGTK